VGDSQILVLVIALLGVASCVVLGVRSWVDSHSGAIRALRSSNARYLPDITPLPPIQRTFAYAVNSKRAVERFELERYLAECLLEQEAFIDRDIRERHRRVQRYPGYLREIQTHRQSLLNAAYVDHAIPRFLWSIERSKFASLTLSAPTPLAEVQAIVHYTSPQGRNSYRRQMHLDYPQLVNELNHARQLRDSRATTQALRQRERSLMSNRLRTDILRRDRGRCRMCGASAAEGVTLHIDHIVPVSHGGRTLSSNLQVLCQECNLGKGARFVG